MDFELMKTMVTNQLPDANVKIMDLTGGGDHLSICVTSDEFKGKMLLAQHQLVMDIFKEELKSNTIHALQVKTKIY